MRVGVLMIGQPAQAGGGHTFEQNVFETLLRLAPESEHRFVILHPTARDLEVPRNVELPLAAWEPLRRVIELTPQRLWVDRAVAAADVDVVWGVSPGHAMTDKPFITVVWDLQHRRQPFFPEVSAGGEWERRERLFKPRVQRAMMTITGTEVGKSEVIRYYQVAPERVRVLPLPTPRFALEAPRQDASAVRAKYGLPERYLFYPAQFWAHKNHANLLLALERLEKKHALTLPLVLVGSDPGNRAHVDALTEKLGLRSRVQVLGFVPLADMVALYREAFALVYVSLFGPDNLPPLEAFALGCPVVASNVDGADEQLGDAALLVDATQPDAIAAAVKSLADDPQLRARLVERGLARARRFTGDDYVRGVFAILDQMVPFVRCWRP